MIGQKSPAYAPTQRPPFARGRIIVARSSRPHTSANRAPSYVVAVGARPPYALRRAEVALPPVRLSHRLYVVLAFRVRASGGFRAPPVPPSAWLARCPWMGDVSFSELCLFVLLVPRRVGHRPSVVHRHLVIVCVCVPVSCPRYSWGRCRCRRRPPARRRHSGVWGSGAPSFWRVGARGYSPSRLGRSAHRCPLRGVFCLHAARFATPKKKGFPYGAVAHSLPPFFWCRASAVCTPFLSRPWGEAMRMVYQLPICALWRERPKPARHPVSGIT